ncbi:MAG: hypothetical protein AVDCRST_MAG64-2985, partial [uncultured Phycisphaerae bacterium]
GRPVRAIVCPPTSERCGIGWRGPPTARRHATSSTPSGGSTCL